MQFSKTEEDNSIWKKALLVLIFFLITPVALGTSLVSLITLSKTNEVEKAEVKTPNTIYNHIYGVQVYASLPSSFPSISGEVTSADSKVGLIHEYLLEKESSLAPYAEFIVKTAEKYGLDYRLTTAIAQKESGLCKVIPEGSHNCWGWGIHSKGTLTFNTYEEAIDTVSRGIKENYIDQGYITLEEIMAKYTPLSPGTWAEGVGFYMNQILEN